MTDWQPIETAPKDGRIIVVCGAPASFKDGRPMDGPCIVRWDDNAYSSEGDWVFAGWLSHGDPIHDFPIEEPTHWMPLPDPPA